MPTLFTDRSSGASRRTTRGSGGEPTVHYQLVSLTADLALTLVTPPTSAGWMLPGMEPHTWRTAPDRALALLDREATHANVVHTFPLEPNPNSAHVDDVGVVSIVTGPARTSDTVLIPTSELLSRSPLLPQQRDVLATALEHLRTPTAPFDSYARAMDATRWAASTVEARTGARVIGIEPVRCGRFDYVVRAFTTDGTFCFKGGPDHVPDESELTHALWVMLPRHFVQTVDIDRDAGRWLTREPAGELLTRSALDQLAAEAAARTLAQIQKRALRTSAIQDRLARRTFGAFDLLSAVDRVLDRTFSDDSFRDHETLMPTWRHYWTPLAELCDQVDRMGLPTTLALSSFHGQHMRADTNGIAVTDVRDAFWSYPFVSLWPFNRQVELTLRSSGEARLRLERAFVVEWADIIAPQDMNRVLPYIPLLGSFSEFLYRAAEFDRQGRDLGHPLPSWYVARRMASTFKELLDICHMFWPSIDPSDGAH